MLWLTLGIIIAVTLLVLLEKTIAPRIRSWGDVYPVLLNFLVILLKIIIPLVLLWKISDLSPRSLSWVRGDLFQVIWKGLALAAFMMAFIFIYQKYSHLVFGEPYISTGGRFLEQKISGVAIGIVFSAALLNAFGEEIIFRGMLLPSLSPYMGISMALIVQSLIFTVYHFFPLQNSVLLFIMGLFFGLGYLWSGCLLTPILAHLIENGVAALIFLIRLFRAG